jgi:hypothetical protein
MFRDRCELLVQPILVRSIFRGHVLLAVFLSECFSRNILYTFFVYLHLYYTLCSLDSWFLDHRLIFLEECNDDNSHSFIFFIIPFLRLQYVYILFDAFSCSTLLTL